MITPPLPLDDAQRLAVLYSLNVLDTPAEERFDRITRTAQQTFNMPIALISLVDENRQWFKSCQGLSATETPRGISFCGHAILEDKALVIPDALLDPRFFDNPFVVNEPYIRFYAGQPLSGPGGSKLGTLCIVDTQPRQFSAADLQALYDLSKWAENELNSLTHNRTLAIVQESENHLRESEQRYRVLYEAAQRSALNLALQDRIRTELTRELDLTTIFKTIVEALSESFENTCVSLYLLEGQQLVLQSQVGYQSIALQLPATQGVFGRVVASGKSLPLKPSETTTQICVPLFDRRELVGLLNIESIGKPFSNSDLRSITALSEHAALAIGRARLFNEARESEKKYRSVFESIKEVIFQTNDSGFLTLLNPAWSEITGYSIEETLGCDFFRFIHPADRRSNAELFQPLIEGKVEHCRHTIRFLTKDGGIRWLEVLARLTLEPDNLISGMSGTLNDVTERKQAEEVLRDNEERYRTVITVLEEGIVLQDINSTILTCNNSAERILGLSVDQMAGRTSLDLGWRAIHEDGSPFPGDTHPSIYTLTTGWPCSNVIMGVHKPDNNLTWISINTQPLFKPGDKVPYAVVCSLTDITERKLAEEAIRKSEELYRTLAKNIPNASVLLFDRDLRYTLAEGTSLAQHGLDKEFIEGKTIWEVLPEYGVAVVEPYYRAALEGKTTVFEAKYENDFTYLLHALPVKNEQGEIFAGMLMTQDISEQKRVEETLRKSEARNRAFLNAIPDMMLRISKTGEVLDYKAANDGSLMLSSLIFLGKNMHEILPKDLAKEVFHYIEQALQSGTNQTYEHSHSIKRKQHDYEMRVVISGEDEVLLIVRDITERKQIERMKNEFISTVSHELRTPLTSIRGSLGLVANGVAGELPPMARTMIDIASKNSERLIRLINDILDIEKIESGKLVFNLQSLELLPLIEQTLEANLAYAEQFNVKFQLLEGLNRVKINGDSDRLMQVMTNLLSNAVKFSPSQEVVDISMTRHNGMIRIAIADHGPGIPEEFRKRIFQKFAQADSSDTRQKGGTGLGLSISKAIVEKHGGQIGFESNLNSGTIFYFDLPEWSEEETPDPIPANLSEASSSSLPQVLYVEDDPDLLQVVSVILDKIASVSYAMSLEQARHKLRTERFDLVILDLDIPGGSGLELLPLLNLSNDSTIPVVIFSVQEVTPEVACQVAATLVKSHTSNQKLASTVKNLLALSQIAPVS